MPSDQQTPQPPRLDEELFMSLERDQLVAGRSRALTRARLSRRARMALWSLRIFVLVVGAMVIYTFVAQL
jgi:hypothetical protein